MPLVVLIQNRNAFNVILFKAPFFSSPVFAEFPGAEEHNVGMADLMASSTFRKERKNFFDYNGSLMLLE